MLVELHRKAGRLCREARKGNIRCGLIVRNSSEDVLTSHLVQAFRILNPRWWLPDILNMGLRSRRFCRQLFRGLEIEPWHNRPRYPRELLDWDEGSTQCDVRLQWTNPSTVVYLEMKYLADLSPNTANGPSDQLIRLVRNGLLECGWFKGNFGMKCPRDFVCLLVTPNQGHTLIHRYQNPENILAAIPHHDKLRGLPRGPFIGHLSYQQLIQVLKRQRSRFTCPEIRLIDQLVEYLSFKLERANGGSAAPSEVGLKEPSFVNLKTSGGRS